MKIITGKKVIKRETLVALSDARRVIEEAHLIADNVIKEAEQRAASIESSARKRGFEAGKELATEIFSEAVAFKRKTIKELKQSIVDLAVRIAKHIVCSQPHVSEKLLEDAFNRLLIETGRGERIKLIVSRGDYEFALNFIKERQRLTGGDVFNYVDVIAADSISSGGCMVETERMRIDATLDGQLKAIEAGLRKALDS